MPTLNWIGKDKVINHHQEVPYKILEHKYGFSDGLENDTETNSGNLIIHGDNLEALKALLPKYQGKVNCIYIDPPYNTGNEKWVYNDNVNDEKIKKWLGEVVGQQGDDRDNSDSKRKIELGTLWANKAGDNYRYYMVFNSSRLEGAITVQELIERLKNL